MVSVRRQRLKAIRAGVSVEKANACSDSSELVKLMMDLNIKQVGDMIKDKKKKKHGKRK